MRDPVSRLYKTTGKITVILILVPTMFKFIVQKHPII